MMLISHINYIDIEEKWIGVTVVKISLFDYLLQYSSFFKDNNENI